MGENADKHTLDGTSVTTSAASSHDQSFANADTASKAAATASSADASASSEATATAGSADDAAAQASADTAAGSADAAATAGSADAAATAGSADAAAAQAHAAGADGVSDGGNLNESAYINGSTNGSLDSDDNHLSDTATVGLSYGGYSKYQSPLPEPDVSACDAFQILNGIPASRGIAVGRISFLQRDAQLATRRSIEDVDAEVARFETARAEAIAQLGTLYETTVEKLGDQNAVVFQIHQMMLDDPEYVDGIESTTRDEKVSA